MKLNKLHIIILTSLLCMLLYSGMAYTQDRIIYVEKGEKTYTASSPTANSFMWLLNGDTLAETTSTFTRDWAEGNYWLTAIPYFNGCVGDSFSAQLIIKEDVTQNDGQATFVNNSVEVCPASNAKPVSGELEILIKFSGETLNTGESFAIKYRIDDGAPVTTQTFKKYEASFTINTLALDPGQHKIKITRLMYGQGFSKQVDYSTSIKIPTMLLNVKPMLNIGEIGFE